MKVFTSSFEFEFESEEFGTVSCLARVEPGEAESWDNPIVYPSIDYLKASTLADGVEVELDLTETARAEDQAMYEWEDRCADLNCSYDED